MEISEVSLKTEELQPLFKETVIAVNRVSKVVKGGKRLSFNAVAVVGDQAGSVGVGLGKAKDVRQAVNKAIYKARKVQIKVALLDSSIPHEIVGKCGAAKVLLKPASSGTGIIAGGSVRAVLEAAGIKDILSKCLGSTNPVNVAYATLDGLKRLRTKEQIAELRVTQK
ncbi:MAG: 30S ribosomal protein S5 [Elusimicrobiota bacterium]|nr:30S ribosomal protein S5 [Elusimicrobiota bacterium]